jgi:AraC-like DNA-binding protein
VNTPASTSPSYRYAERAPSAAIAPWVLSLWSFQADATPPADQPYTVWPDGCMSLGLSRDTYFIGLICVGPRLTAMRPPVLAGRRLWGFRLWPDVIGAVTGLRARDLRDYMGLAPAACAARFAGLDAALPRGDDSDEVLGALDRFLSTRLTDCPTPEARIRAAVRAIVAQRGEVAMLDVARAAHVGLRHLQRRFPDATGLTLREYARVRRLREALARRLVDGHEGWSRVAAETGFVDHAHLSREFVALTGVQPSAAARQLHGTEHDTVVP